MTRNKKKRKWDWLLEVLSYVPELLIESIKLVARGIVSIFKHWS
ncbi:hypothetical protein [Lentibacillus juripiscarius]|uniref:Uncharacterized protein n=1 Tax=Lentibacillus juripiscarius TaxID=257446 RepID=A0ABW5VCJ3_9BACI